MEEASKEAPHAELAVEYWEYVVYVAVIATTSITNAVLVATSQDAISCPESPSDMKLPVFGILIDLLGSICHR